jgi:hypothetical protein
MIKKKIFVFFEHVNFPTNKMNRTISAPTAVIELRQYSLDNEQERNA